MNEQSRKQRKRSSNWSSTITDANGRVVKAGLWVNDEFLRAASVPQVRDTRELVLKAQQILSALGYEPGPVDGVAGNGTVRAVRRFQLAQGNDPDGELTLSLLASLQKVAGSSVRPPVVEARPALAKV